jgi:sarcosine oxidase subunit beta
MKKKSAEVVIVGGGVRGLVIAYSLAKAGVDVAVIEKRFVGAGASGLNMGYINVSAKKPAFYTKLSKMSADMYPRFNEELDVDIEYRRNGALEVAQTQEDWEKLTKIVAERNQVAGINMRMVNIDELRQLEPALSPQLLGGSWCPNDGAVHALKLTRALARAATFNGARIYQHHEVLDIRVASGRIEAVATTYGSIATHVVVNTAGIHVPRIAMMVGVDVPVFPERGQLIITEELPKILNRTVGGYKQFEDGQMLIGITNEDVGENTAVTTREISRCARQAIEIIPALKQARAIRCAAALRPMTPDRRPIYHKMVGISDFYVAVGHSGITLAPITGKIFSDLITKGQTDVPIAEYGLARFNATGA